MKRRILFVPLLALSLVGCNAGTPNAPQEQADDSPYDPGVLFSHFESIDSGGLSEQIAAWPHNRRPSMQGKWEQGERPSTLRELHAFSVHQFIISPGFGYERMPPLHESPGSTWVSRIGEISLKDRIDTDRANVDAKWTVERLQLMGLVKRPAGVVYRDKVVAMRFGSKKPAGEQNSDAPLDATMRPLDEFESIALRDLQLGRDLVLHEENGRIRMLGSIRASAQCLNCHDVPEKTLLGAFSYDLARLP